MPETKTQRFLRLVNEQNAQIAERKAKEAEADKKRGLDPVRIQKDAERREKLGQLRARPKPRRKTHKVSSVFPVVDLRE